MMQFCLRYAALGLWPQAREWLDLANWQSFQALWLQTPDGAWKLREKEGK